MICSRKHGFLFVKTRKTASTSTEMALTTVCGPQDIVTPISPEDEIQRLALGQRPANYSDEPLRERIVDLAAHTRNAKILRQVRKMLGPQMRFFNHMKAERIKQRLPETLWNSVYRFSIERHPYEKVVSQSYYMKGAMGRKLADRSISDVIESVIERQSYLNYPLYTIDGKLAVHKVLRYERLHEELNALLADLGVPEVSKLQKAKSGFRKKRTPAADLLSPEQKKAIQQGAAFEFELMGYAH
ncbi:MAG: sulfotransferase family 2 domain-containing protein [Pseudomonadota bacterium]